MNFDITKNKLAALSNNTWMTGLPSEALSELLKEVRFKSYKANQCLHRKGELAFCLYGVISGEIRISATTSSGEEIVFTRINAGKWFGEIAILDEGVRTHDAFTTLQSEIAIIPKESITKICGKHPEAYMALVSLLCEHCRQAFAAVDDFLLFSPQQRLAKNVITQLDIIESKRLMINQQELGALIGISRQSTNKILKSWEIKGWVQRIYKGIEVLQYSSLKALFLDIKV
jgi:CRP-like cAMP-binding protein